MITFARFVNAVLAIGVFGFLRVVTADMGNAAWAVSLLVALVVFFILRAILVSPLLKRATNKASVSILEHFAGGGDMNGAVRIARGLGLSASDARKVAEAHKDALMGEVAKRILEEARKRYEEHRDREEVRKYFVERGVPDEDIERAVERIVKEGTH